MLFVIFILFIKKNKPFLNEWCVSVCNKIILEALNSNVPILCNIICAVKNLILTCLSPVYFDRKNWSSFLLSFLLRKSSPEDGRRLLMSWAIAQQNRWQRVHNNWKLVLFTLSLLNSEWLIYCTFDIYKYDLKITEFAGDSQQTSS